MLLIQVCEAQFHFARQEDGEKAEMPHFAGQKGPEIVRGLLDIEAQFEKNLAQLRLQKKTILDVKATSWHDNYNKYVIPLVLLSMVVCFFVYFLVCVCLCM